jgi:hypothetical protein
LELWALRDKWLMRVSAAELDAAIEQVQQERRARAAAASG